MNRFRAWNCAKSDTKMKDGAQLVEVTMMKISQRCFLRPL